ncbi:hypothetical protein FBU59_006540, partial [Linderina macrospora]
MDSNTADRPVNLIIRFPFKRPADFRPPTITEHSHRTLEEQVWRYLLSIPGQRQPLDILSEIEEDEVTFDWGLLAQELSAPLHDVLAAAASLFERHVGRSLKLADSEVQITARSAVEQFTAYTREAQQSPPKAAASKSPKEDSGSGLDDPVDTQDLENAGLRSVESLGGQSEAPSPVVELSTTTPPAETSLEASIREAVDSDHSMRTASAVAARISLAQRSMEPDRGAAMSYQGRNRESPLSFRGSPMEPRSLQQWRNESGGRVESVRMRSAEASAEASASKQVDPNVSEVQIAGDPVEEQKSASSMGSFSDLSDSSITESALQDALISEAMNASTTGMSSMLR